MRIISDRIVGASNDIAAKQKKNILRVLIADSQRFLGHSLLIVLKFI